MENITLEGNVLRITLILEQLTQRSLDQQEQLKEVFDSLLAALTAINDLQARVRELEGF